MPAPSNGTILSFSHVSTEKHPHRRWAPPSQRVGALHYGITYSTELGWHLSVADLELLEFCAWWSGTHLQHAIPDFISYSLADRHHTQVSCFSLWLFVFREPSDVPTAKIICSVKQEVMVLYYLSICLYVCLSEWLFYVWSACNFWMPWHINFILTTFRLSLSNRVTGSRSRSLK